MFKRLLLALALATLCADASAQQALQLPPAKACFTGSVGTSGVISTLGGLTAGSGGTNGTYSASLLGGNGSGATVTVIVSGGVITSQTLTNPGTGYVVGDVLTASPTAIGGILGYSATVSGTAVSGALAGGSVTFYVPGTTTPKSTWQDSGQATLNTNPVNLDGNGCAIIYGVGSYRQILKDSLGNTVWDQVTSVAPISPYWAGLASGSANAITITYPTFTSTDGQAVQFKAPSANTGAVTLNGIAVQKNSGTGLVPILQGDIGANSVASVVYNATSTAFVLLNPLSVSAPQLDPQAATSIQVSPYFCKYTQLNGTTDNTACVQSAINYACSVSNALGTNVGGEIIFARALYYIKTGVTVPQSCSGLMFRGQGFGNPTSVNTHAAGSIIVSDNNCTGPIFNIYNDATANYIYGGAIRNIAFWNSTLTGGDPYGANACKQPLIQVNHAQAFSADHIYAWQPYKYVKYVGGIFLDLDYVYGDEALQDSPSLFEFTGWGAKPDTTAQATRQDQVLMQHVMVFGNTNPQAGHKLPIGIWWHGFAVSLKTFDTEMQYVSQALVVDCTTTGIAATEIGACPAFGVFNDFESEGANGGSLGLVSITDAQSLDFNFLYAACFYYGGPLGGCGYVVDVKNTTFNSTGTITVRGGQLNGGRASGIRYEGFNLTVIGGTHLWGNDATNVGGADITIQSPVASNAFGSHQIIGNLFCVDTSGTNPNVVDPTHPHAENAINSLASNDYILIIGNVFRGCAAGVIGTIGGHGVNSPNSGP